MNFSGCVDGDDGYSSCFEELLTADCVCYFVSAMRRQYKKYVCSALEPSHTVAQSAIPEVQ